MKVAGSQGENLHLLHGESPRVNDVDQPLVHHCLICLSCLSYGNVPPLMAGPQQTSTTRLNCLGPAPETAGVSFVASANSGAFPAGHSRSQSPGACVQNLLGAGCLGNFAMQFLPKVRVQTIGAQDCRALSSILSNSNMISDELLV